MNVGGIEFSVKVAHLEKSIKDVSKAQKEFYDLDRQLKANKVSQENYDAAMRKAINKMKGQSGVILNATRKTYDYKNAMQGLSKSKDKYIARLQKQISAERRLAAEIAKSNKKPATAKSGFNAFSQNADEMIRKNREAMAKMHGQALQMNKSFNQKKINQERLWQGKALAEDKKYNAKKIAEANKAYSKIGSYAARGGAKAASATAKSAKQQISWINRLGDHIKQNHRQSENWIERFGVRALGFYVAYRAIYVFTNAVGQLTNAFARGLTMMDEYAEGVSVIAGMVGVIRSDQVDFMETYTNTSRIMNETLKESMRIAPMYRLSMDEITAGYRELAQFGVLATKSMAEGSIVAFSMIKEIAAAVGSTSKQLRQEIQAIFTGTARASDQFARMIKNTMPDVWDMISQPGLDPTEKWEKLTAALKDYGYAAIVASQTVRGQFEKLGNSIAVISMDALKASGIWDHWMETVKGFNDALFTSSGELTSYGQKVQTVFEDIWNTLNNGVDVLKEVGSWFRRVYDRLKELDEQWNGTLSKLSKGILVMAALSAAFKTLAAAVKGLAVISGLNMLPTIFTVLFGKPSVASIQAAAVAMGKYAAIVTALVGTFMAAVWAGRQLIGVWGGLKAAGQTTEELDAMKEKHLENNKAITESYRQRLLTEADTYKERKVIEEEFAKALVEEKDRYMEARQAKSLGIGDMFKQGRKEALQEWDDSAEFLAEEATKGIKGFYEQNIEGFVTALHPKNLSENILGDFTDVYDSLEDLFNNKKKLTRAYMGDWEDVYLESFSHVFGQLDDTKFSLAAETSSDKFLYDNFSASFDKTVEKGKQSYDELGTIGKRTAEGVSGFWRDVMTLEIKNTEDLFSSLGEHILGTFVDVFVEMADAYLKIFIKSIVDAGVSSSQTGDSSIWGTVFQGAMALFGGGSAGASGAVGSTIGGATSSFLGGSAAASNLGGSFMDYDFSKTVANKPYAKGGVINEPVFGFGTNSGQSYSFAEKGPERVLSNKDSFAQSSVNVSVNVVNKSSSQVKSETSAPRFDGKKMIIDVFMEDYTNGGQTYKALKG